jgi:hypothetical protein
MPTILTLESPLSAQFWLTLVLALREWWVIHTMQQLKHLYSSPQQFLYFPFQPNPYASIDLIATFCNLFFKPHFLPRKAHKWTTSLELKVTITETNKITMH